MYYKLIIKWVDHNHKIVKKDEFARDTEEQVKSILIDQVKRGTKGYEIWWSTHRIEDLGAGVLKSEGLRNTKLSIGDLK